jgi:hypothetical protein
VTAACPYLGAVELGAITGIAGSVAQEQPPLTTEGSPKYTCAYVAGNQKPEGAPKLHFFAFPKVNPDKPVSSFAKNCPGPNSPIPGVADAATYCDTTDYWTTVVIAKRVQGETRMVGVELPHQQIEAYTQLAKLLSERL